MMGADVLPGIYPGFLSCGSLCVNSIMYVCFVWLWGRSYVHEFLIRPSVPAYHSTLLL